MRLSSCLIVAGVLLGLLLVFAATGCDTVGSWIEAAPITPEQADAAAQTTQQVSAWLPQPAGWIGTGVASLLALYAEAKRRRAAREKQTIYDGAVQIVGSVKQWLDARPDDERIDIKSKLAVAQGSEGKALVSQAKATLAAE